MLRSELKFQPFRRLKFVILKPNAFRNGNTSSLSAVKMIIFLLRLKSE
jgi:hypothetical protein